MKKKKTVTKTLSEQLRQIIKNGNMTRYEISKRSGVDASQLHRFVHTSGGLSMDSLDRIAQVLRIRLVAYGKAGE